jgi:hypothetical protein
MSTVARPVKLQVNERGSWRDVVRFDAGNDFATEKVMDAANSLGAACPSTKYRIATDEALPQVLMYWKAETGWVKS